jgi:hypothetical protein
MTKRKCEYCGEQINGYDNLEIHRRNVCFRWVKKNVKCFKCKWLNPRKLWCSKRIQDISLESWFASECPDFQKFHKNNIKKKSNSV